MIEPLSPTEFGRILFALGQAWRREMDTRMRRFGLSDATWRPLLHLGRLGDGVRQTDLATALNIEGASLVRLLDILERAALIKRVDDPEDRRSKRVQMTSEGHAVYDKVRVVHEELCRQLLADATPREIAICSRLFAKLDRTIKATRTAGDGA